MRILGLIRQSSWNPFGLTQNHQVLAYGYSDDGTTRKLRIYDPNHPNDDTVTLEITDAGLKQSTGETAAGRVRRGVNPAACDSRGGTRRT